MTRVTDTYQFNVWCVIHKENPTRCNNVSKFYYSIFIWSSI